MWAISREVDFLLYKFISETKIERQPLYIKENGMVISNQPEEKLRALGYKDLVTSPQPETEPGYYVTAIYTDGDVITQTWSEPVKAEGDISDSEALAIITGGMQNDA